MWNKLKRRRRECSPTTHFIQSQYFMKTIYWWGSPWVYSHSPSFTTMNYRCPVPILYKSHVARFQCQQDSKFSPVAQGCHCLPSQKSSPRTVLSQAILRLSRMVQHLDNSGVSPELFSLELSRLAAVGIGYWSTRDVYARSDHLNHLSRAKYGAARDCPWSGLILACLC